MSSKPCLLLRHSCADVKRPISQGRECATRIVLAAWSYLRNYQRSLFLLAILFIVNTIFSIFPGVLSKGASPVFVEETFAPIDQFEAVGRQLLGGMYTPFLPPSTISSFFSYLAVPFRLSSHLTLLFPHTQFLCACQRCPLQPVKLKAIEALHFHSCPNF